MPINIILHRPPIILTIQKPLISKAKKSSKLSLKNKEKRNVNYIPQSKKKMK